MSINSLSLALLVDDVVARLFLLDKPTTTIGRGTDSDIQIDQCGVSNKHACIRIMPSEFMENHNDIFLEDLGSRNGTLVNNKQIKCRLLKPNDVITIAWTRFKVIDDFGSGDATTAYILLD
jgi:pSer/pThr/pTyr-binding forkhead associated (FHA) protein